MTKHCYLFITTACLCLLQAYINALIVRAGESALVKLHAGLPELTGPYAVGRQCFDWVDGSRNDPYASEPGKHRELMVYLWYPARNGSSKSLADYVPGAVQMQLDPLARPEVQDEYGAVWPSIVSGLVTPHARRNATPVEGKKFPVVLFSHGFSADVFSYTAQIEDLTSHGYVVVGIEHTDAARAVFFPDGRVRLMHEQPAPAAKDPLQAMIASAMAGTQIGAEDVRFVLDQLAGAANTFKSIMDFERVAAVGHSYGGTLTARACQLDARIRACISEDGEINPVGAFFDYPDHTAMKQPFLLLAVDWHPTPEVLGHMNESEEQWRKYLAHSREQLALCPKGSYRISFSAAGMTHSSFSDGPLLNAPPGSPQAATALKNLQLTIRVERAFLDRVLKHQAVVLLGPSSHGEAGMTIARVGKGFAH